MVFIACFPKLPGFILFKIQKHPIRNCAAHQTPRPAIRSFSPPISSAAEGQVPEGDPAMRQSGPASDGVAGIPALLHLHSMRLLENGCDARSESGATPALPAAIRQAAATEFPSLPGSTAAVS